MGFHMRPAKKFAVAMAKYSSSVNIVFGAKSYNAKSIMLIMAAGIPRGGEITVECEGEDESAALTEATEIIENTLCK